MNQEDPYHCRCFSIHNSQFDNFRQQLENIGFKDTLLQENHGQVYGLVKRLDEYTQIHVKVIRNGSIEAEMEYPPDYPVAHLNQEHSYSAHYELQEIMNSFGIPHTFRINPPLSCLQRIRKFANNPTHAKVIAGVALGAVAIGALAYALSKMDDEE